MCSFCSSSHSNIFCYFATWTVEHTRTLGCNSNGSVIQNHLHFLLCCCKQVENWKWWPMNEISPVVTMMQWFSKYSSCYVIVSSCVCTLLLAYVWISNMYSAFLLRISGVVLRKLWLFWHDLCMQSSSSLESNLEGLAAVLDADLPNYKSKILNILMEW